MQMLQPIRMSCICAPPCLFYYYINLFGIVAFFPEERGGLGANLAIGIALAFVFVFSFEVLKLVSSSQTLSPLVAMWLPNIVFAPIAFYLYWKRANQ